MTEENKAVDTQEEVDTQAEPTVKVAEMKRRIDLEQKKAQEQLDAMNQTIEQKIAEAVEKAEKEANLSGKELDEYRKQEAERKEQELKDKIAKLELEATRRELKDEAINTLSEKKLPVNEKVLKLVVKDTAEATLSAIDDIASIISDVVSEYSATDAPLASGGVAKPTNSPGEIFRNANILNKQKER